MKTSVSERTKRPPVPMSPVKSSFIEAIGYDDKEKTVHVRLLDGDTYLYPEVPAEQFAKFKRARSKGKFFGKHFQKAEHIRRKREPK